MAAVEAAAVEPAAVAAADPIVAAVVDTIVKETDSSNQSSLKARVATRSPRAFFCDIAISLHNMCYRKLHTGEGLGLPRCGLGFPRLS